MRYENLDLVDLEGWGGEGGDLVAPGTYELEITDKDVRQGAKGPYHNVRFKVAANADGTPSTEEGRTVFGIYPMSGKGAKRLKSLLDATETVLDERGGYDDEEWLGQHIIATVAENPYPDRETGEKRDGRKVMNEVSLAMYRGEAAAPEAPAKQAAPKRAPAATAATAAAAAPANGSVAPPRAGRPPARGQRANA
jgi:hypothetical protein